MSPPTARGVLESLPRVVVGVRPPIRPVRHPVAVDLDVGEDIASTCVEDWARIVERGQRRLLDDRRCAHAAHVHTGWDRHRAHAAGTSREVEGLPDRAVRRGLDGTRIVSGPIAHRPERFHTDQIRRNGCRCRWQRRRRWQGRRGWQRRRRRRDCRRGRRACTRECRRVVRAVRGGQLLRTVDDLRRPRREMQGVRRGRRTHGDTSAEDHSEDSENQCGERATFHWFPL